MTYQIYDCYYATDDDAFIACTWDHPTLGTIPFWATPTDVMPYGAEIYINAQRGEYGTLTSYADSHWYSTINDNIWLGGTYNIGDLMISPTGVQPPNSTDTPPA